MKKFYIYFLAGYPVSGKSIGQIRNSESSTTLLKTGYF